MQILLKLRRWLWPLYIRLLPRGSSHIKRLPPIHSLFTIRIAGFFLQLLLSHIYKLILHFRIAKPEDIIMLQSLLGIGSHLLIIDPTTFKAPLSCKYALVNSSFISILACLLETETSLTWTRRLGFRPMMVTLCTKGVLLLLCKLIKQNSGSSYFVNLYLLAYFIRSSCVCETRTWSWNLEPDEGAMVMRGS